MYTFQNAVINLQERNIRHTEKRIHENIYDQTKSKQISGIKKCTISYILYVKMFLECLSKNLLID